MLDSHPHPHPHPHPRKQQQQQQQQNKNKNKNKIRFVVDTDNDDNDKDEPQANDDEDNEPTSVDNNNKKKTNSNKKIKIRSYLDSNRIFKWFSDNPINKDIIQSPGNQNYLMKAAPIYDEWLRTQYEYQVWENYLKLAQESKHWAKEIVNRTNNRKNTANNFQFINKKLSQFKTKIHQKAAEITSLQIELGNYWNYTAVKKRSKQTKTTMTNSNNPADMIILAGAPDINITPAITATTITATTNTTTAPSTSIDNHTDPEFLRNDIQKVDKLLINYIEENIQHIRNMAENRVKLAKLEMIEYKSFEDFKQIATPNQICAHEIIRTKVKVWHTTNKNYHTADKRLRFNILPKFVAKTNLNFKFNKTIRTPAETQAIYDRMNQITMNYHKEAMEVFTNTLAEDAELLKYEIDQLIKGFPKDDTNEIDPEVCLEAFKDYHKLRLQRYDLQLQQAVHF
ncbi:unnamed protein product [Adineta ricciae]|uniref:Uncharacterized protein n=1 Tax=Adineta ricciae TaxID=249248 RepID=A0A815LYY8_ADIRI|nr:unnamed protein product [Adineta ricciae]